MSFEKQCGSCLLLACTLIVIFPIAKCCDTTVDTMGCQFYVQSKNSSSCTQFDLRYCQWKVCDYYRKDSKNNSYCAHYSMKTSSSWGSSMNECCRGSDGPQTYETLNSCYEENKKIAIIIGAVIGGIVGLALLIFLIYLAVGCLKECFGAIFQCVGGFFKGIANFFRNCFSCFPKSDKKEGSEGQIYIVSDPVLPKMQQVQMEKDEWTDFESQFDGKQICAICLKNNSSVRLQCKHTSHQQCIAEWLTQKTVCPQCNKQITKMTLYCRECMKKKKLISREMIGNKSSPLIQYCQNCS